MSEHILVFGLGFEIPARLRAVGEASGRKVVTSVMCLPEHLPKINDADRHARILVLDPEASDDEWVALAQAVDAMDAVTRVGTFYDDCRRQATVVAEALGLPTYAPDLVALVEDKHATRERLAKSGLEETPSAVVDSTEAVLAFAREHGYPCVVKPTTGTASKGVSIIHGPAESTPAFERAAGAARWQQVVVEEFLQGPQYSVEAFSEEGEHVVVAITQKYSDPVSLVELGHVMPAPLPPEEEETLVAHVVGALDALGIGHGPTHTEVILTDHGPRIVETHLRTGGDELWNMVTDATGVDLIEAQLRQVLGEKVLKGVRATLDDPNRRRSCEAVWFAGAPTGGTLVEVSGADTERPGVTLETLRSAGTRLSGLEHSDSRLAQARAHADTAEEAMALAKEAIDSLSIVVKHSAVQTDYL